MSGPPPRIAVERLLAKLQFELTIVLTKLARQVSDKTHATETQDLST